MQYTQTWYFQMRLRIHKVALMTVTHQNELYSEKCKYLADFIMFTTMNAG